MAPEARKRRLHGVAVDTARPYFLRFEVVVSLKANAKGVKESPSPAFEKSLDVFLGKGDPTNTPRDIRGYKGYVRGDY